MKALVIRVGEEPQIIDSKWDYQEIFDLVGGYIESVSFGDNQYFAYINEEGKMLDLPENKVVTEFWYDSGQVILLGDYIAGNVIFFGGIDANGDNMEIDDSLLDQIMPYFNKSYSWQDIANLTHQTQVKDFGFCTCEDNEGNENPYEDCPTEQIERVI